MMNSASALPRYRIKALDIILVLLFASLAVWLYYRASVALQYHWQWSKALTLIFTPSADGGPPYFFQGLVATLRLSLWGMLFASVIGLLLALAQASHYLLVRQLANAYIQLIRNIPPLVFVFIFYFFIANQLVPMLGLQGLLREHNGNINDLQAMLFGPAMLWENLLSGVLCVGMIAAAYIAEVLRAGVVTIAKGQWEAGQTLGLSRWSQLRYIIAPQVITAVTPALAGQFISLVKDSSIIALISIQELTFVGTEIANSSGMIFEIWLCVGICYLLLCLLLSLAFRYLENASQRHLQR